MLKVILDDYFWLYVLIIMRQSDIFRSGHNIDTNKMTGMQNYNIMIQINLMYVLYTWDLINWAQMGSSPANCHHFGAMKQRYWTRRGSSSKNLLYCYIPYNYTWLNLQSTSEVRLTVLSGSVMYNFYSYQFFSLQYVNLLTNIILIISLFLF